MDMCVSACEELGSGLAAWIFAGVAFAWGAWTRRNLAHQKRETELYRVLSLRPPPRIQSVGELPIFGEAQQSIPPEDEDRGL